MCIRFDNDSVVDFIQYNEKTNESWNNGNLREGIPGIQRIIYRNVWMTIR